MDLCPLCWSLLLVIEVTLAFRCRLVVAVFGHLRDEVGQLHHFLLGLVQVAERGWATHASRFGLLSAEQKGWTLYLELRNLRLGQFARGGDVFQCELCAQMFLTRRILALVRLLRECLNSNDRFESLSTVQNDRRICGFFLFRWVAEERSIWQQS